MGFTLARSIPQYEREKTMHTGDTRRSFLVGSSAAAAALTVSKAWSLPPVLDDELSAPKDHVQFDSSLEPLVQQIEQTPRADLIAAMTKRVQDGVSYQQMLAALFLAAIRNVQPRPSVGFKFHAVLVVHSCHLASVAGPSQERWLPLFWALDYFKSSQADEAKRSGWRMAAVNESLVPDAAKARQTFDEAMQSWDVEKADVAIAALVRHCGAAEVFERFATYAARDYRSIGHKAIYLANAWRTLQVIGYRHAEPVMRSLGFALLNHEGQPNPAQSDLPADRSWRQIDEMLDARSDAYGTGPLDSGATSALLQSFRDGTGIECARHADQALAAGVSSQSIWDGILVGGGELLMRQPGIVGLHTLTTANAMHYLWQTSANTRLRSQLLLQAAAFVPQFRQSCLDRGKLAAQTLDDLQPSEGPVTLDGIFDSVSKDRQIASREVLQFLSAGGDAHEFINEARTLLFFKGRDAHDYKFVSAVLEDAGHVSPQWRNQFLATSVFNMRGSGHRDNALMKRARGSLK